MGKNLVNILIKNTNASFIVHYKGLTLSKRISTYYFCDHGDLFGLYKKPMYHSI